MAPGTRQTLCVSPHSREAEGADPGEAWCGVIPMPPLATRSIGLSLLLTLGASCAAVGQVAPSANVRSTAWGFAALGIGAASDSTFYAAGIGAAVQFRKLVLLGRIASVGPKQENRMEDLGFLVVGLGVRGFLSLNRIATFGGLTLHVQVGRLR